MLHRVPWIHIKYVKSSSHPAVEKLCNPRNSSWVAAHHPPWDSGVQRVGQLPTASTPAEERKSQGGSAHKVSLRRAGDMLGFCFMTWWLRSAQISEVSITQFRDTSICLWHTLLARLELGAKFWFCKLLWLQICAKFLQIIVILTCDKSGPMFRL